MKAFILAAGYGTRLEPLTMAVPKPMAPIVNLPCMQHNLELLLKYGFTDITANIHYHPEQIENYFGDGSAFGVNLTYSYEEELLGTAGGVKRMAEEVSNVEETFIILSSDALTDIDLGSLLAYHRKKKALVTIALAKALDVSQFGVVIQDAAGKIVDFQEKPDAQTAKSDLVNTGIYVMEPEVLQSIPVGFYDFGKQLFPLLIKEKVAIYGYVMDEYWSDVGSLPKYVAANMDVLQGKVKVRIPAEQNHQDVWLGKRQKIDASVQFSGKVLVGDRVTIGKNVQICDSIIGNKCVISDGSQIKGSIIWSDTMVGRKVEICSAVLGSWCFVGEDAKIKEGSVLANRCRVKREGVIALESRLQPGQEV